MPSTLPLALLVVKQFDERVTEEVTLEYGRIKPLYWEVSIMIGRALHYEVAESNVPGEFRVEAIDYENDGECYVAIFSGPKAKERAEEYATLKNVGVAVAV